MKYRPLIAVLALATALLPVLASCNEKEDFSRPSVRVKSADWRTVPESGGTIEVEDIVLDFPAGACNNGGKIAVTQVPKGTVKSFKKHQVSAFYQVVIPSPGFSKPFKVSFHYSGVPENVMIVEESAKWYRYEQKMDLCPTPLKTTVKEGMVSAVIPIIHDEEGEELFFTIGLIEDVAAESSSKTKGGGTGTSHDTDTSTGNELDKPDLSTSNLFTYTVAWDVDNEAHKDPIVELVNKEVPKLIPIYADLGISFSEYPVPYIITADFHDTEVWGEHRTAKTSTATSGVYLNVSKFYELVDRPVPDPELYGNFQQTLIHETFHWIHEEVYDTRWASTINLGGFFGTKTAGQWQFLSESIATWIEKFTGDKNVSDLCPKEVKSLAKTMMCDDGVNYQDHGYGAGYFIEWLSQKTSNRKIANILKKQKEGATDPRAVFDGFLKENGVKFFTPQTNWQDFIWKVLQGKFDSRVNMFQDLQGKPIVLKHAYECEMDYPEKGGKNDDRDVYNFGMALQFVKVHDQMMEKLKANPGLSIVHRQETKDLITWISTSEFNPVGFAVNDTTFALNLNHKGIFDEDHLNKYILATVRRYQDTDPVVLKSCIKTEILPVFKSLSFSAEKGWDFVSSFWSNKDIIVTQQSGGYNVSADNSSGEHLRFRISTQGHKFTDISGVHYSNDHDHSKDMSVGSIKLDNAQLEGTYKRINWRNYTPGREEVSVSGSLF